MDAVNAAARGTRRSYHHGRDQPQKDNNETREAAKPKLFVHF